jgi:ubiquinone/menaquinone biosynthesis C-methylase UbiE
LLADTLRASTDGESVRGGRLGARGYDRGVAVSTDWSTLVRRWDEQQERYLPAREQRFELMLDVIEYRRPGPRPRILDVCCGTGSISRRVLERFPDASIVGIDGDPAHLELAQRTLGDRVEWRDADLRTAGWSDGLAPESFDAVVSATAIHWFQPEEIVPLYRELARLLRQDGAFLNADHLPVGSAGAAALSEQLLEAWRAAQLEGAEDYYEYRDALRKEPELRPLVEEGDRRFTGAHTEPPLSVDFHCEALLAAGFTDVGEIWRHLGDAILIAIR